MYKYISIKNYQYSIILTLNFPYKYKCVKHDIEFVPTKHF